MVNPLPVSNPVSDLELCDDPLDGDARNGFSQAIDLELQTATVLGGQDPAVFSVSYHLSSAEATSGANPLVSPFSNTTAFSQTLFVRVINNTTGCVNDVNSFEVLVHPEPTAEPIADLSFCDDDTDGDDTNGIVQNIDLEVQTATLLGTQDPNEF